MNVGENKVVAMTYTLRESNANGEVLQEVNEERPFVYLFGMGGLLPAFKEKLDGLAKGKDFDFILSIEEAYGQPSEENVINVRKEAFEVDGKIDLTMLKEGETIPMEDEEGHTFTGIVQAVKDDHVIMDFNHPLAGLNLHFAGKILDVREPTPEELEHGHAHGIDGKEGH